MDKAAAARLANRRHGTERLDLHNTHFANINSSKDVWGIDIPLREMDLDAPDKIDLLLYDHRSDELHTLCVPTAYFRANKDRLVVREDKDCISLELAATAGKRFHDVRPTGGGVPFGQFKL